MDINNELGEADIKTKCGSFPKGAHTQLDQCIQYPQFIPKVSSRGAQKEPQEYTFLKEDVSGWSLVQKGTLWCLEEESAPILPSFLAVNMWSLILGNMWEAMKSPVWSLLQTRVKQVSHISPGSPGSWLTFYGHTWSLNMYHNFLNRETTRHWWHVWRGGHEH